MLHENREFTGTCVNLYIKVKISLKQITRRESTVKHFLSESECNTHSFNKGIIILLLLIYTFTIPYNFVAKAGKEDTHYLKKNFESSCLSILANRLT